MAALLVCSEEISMAKFDELRHPWGYIEVAYIMGRKGPADAALAADLEALAKLNNKKRGEEGTRLYVYRVPEARREEFLARVEKSTLAWVEEEYHQSCDPLAK